MAPASGVGSPSPRRRLQQQQRSQSPPSRSVAEDASSLEIVSLGSPSSIGSGSTGASIGKTGRPVLPPFHLDKGDATGKGSHKARGEGEKDNHEAGVAARALVRTKKLVRALGFFYFLSLGVLFATFTQLLLGDFGGDFPRTAAFLGTCAGVERGVQFFTSPLLGTISDSFGRKPVLLASLSLHLLSLLLVALVPNRDSVLCYFVVNGACNVTLGMLNAMCADLCCTQGKTQEGQLAQQYGKLGMAIGLSMIIGPAVGPTLQKLDVHYPVYLSILCLGACLFLGAVLSETILPKHRSPFKWAKANPFTALRAALQHRRLLLLSVPFCLSQLSECAYQFVVLYTQKRFGWGYVTLGLYVSATGIFLAFVQGNLRYIVPRLVSQHGCVTLGLFSHALGMSVMGLAAQGWMMALTVPPQMAASLRNPGLMSVLSDKVPPEQQGVLQGSVSSLRVLSKAVGGPIFGVVLAFAMSPKAHAQMGDWAIGLPFLVAGACDLVGCLCAWLVFRYCPEMQGGNGAAGQGPMAAAVVSPSRKMEEGLPAKGILRASTLTTVEDTGTEGDSLGGDSSIEEEEGEEDEGVAFETRTNLTFPARHAEFNGLESI